MNTFDLLDDDEPPPVYHWQSMFDRKLIVPRGAQKILCGGEWAKSEVSKKKQDGVSSAMRKQRIL
jgi:hypothetical protein